MLVASLSTNLIANYIPTQNVLLNFLPGKLNSKSAGFIIIFLGFFVSVFRLSVLSQIGILSFIDTVGAFFGPLFGIIIADYYLIRGKEIVNKDIFSSSSDSEEEDLFADDSDSGFSDVFSEEIVTKPHVKMLLEKHGTYTAEEILNEIKEFTWNREVK